MNTDLPRWTEDDSRGLAEQIRLDQEAMRRCIDAVQQDVNARIAAEDNIDDEPDDEKLTEPWIWVKYGNVIVWTIVGGVSLGWLGVVAWAVVKVVSQ